MPQIERVVAAALAGAVLSAAAAQDAVQWRVEDGGNGHWYALFQPIGLDWAGWRDHSKTLGGHLMTLTSEEEHLFCEATFLTVLEPSGQAIIGGYQLPNSEEPYGGWRWVTEEPWEELRPLGGSDSPNCGGENEDCVSVGHEIVFGTLVWNDFPHCLTTVKAFVEWSADCNEDGIVDYGQILDGTFPDENGNGVPDCCDAGTPCDCPADITGDGQVDAADIGVLLAVWNTDGGTIPEADINGDGTVNASDLGLVLGAWGLCS